METVTASLRRLLIDPAGIGEFDFVYSTGLFDYLNQRTARRLVLGMFQILRPAGKLLEANFLPGLCDIGSMETFMDWEMIYRLSRDMVDLTMDILEEDVEEVRIISDDWRTSSSWNYERPKASAIVCRCRASRWSLADPSRRLEPVIDLARSWSLVCRNEHDNEVLFERRFRGRVRISVAVSLVDTGRRSAA